LRKGEKLALDLELQRILCLMNIESFSIALNKEEWISLAKILLKAVEMRF